MLFFLMLIAGAESYKVPCDYTTPVCTCPLNDDDDDDTCEFELIIQKLETFTRYEVTGDGTSIDTNNGRKWYISSTTGELLPTNNISKTITEESTACTQPFTVDGKSMRSFIAVNGRAPGPTLIVYEDRYIVVNVINKLDSNTSIHWHGMHQKNSHWMDGVEHVTQCGIPPGGSFTYIFQATPSGTHWYHSHSGEERTKGLFGALIVKEQETQIVDFRNELQRREYDANFKDMPDQHTLTFLDWQHEDKPDKMDTFSPDGAEVSPFVYWSGIINGKGRHEDVPYTETRLSIFNVSSDNTYRFRLIGAQSIFAYRVSVDEHKLIVIATDGAFLEPMEVDYIIIHSGERYDFLLNTKTRSEIDNLNRKNFMIRADTLEVEPHFAEAILHYDTGNNSEPDSTDYESIKQKSDPVSNSCTNTSPCKVLNCPFKDYPSDSLTCIHIHNVELMFLDYTNLPDGEVGEDDKLFFNFGFEGPKDNANSMNARRMKLLPSCPFSLSVGSTEKSNEIHTKIQNAKCKELKHSKTCDNNYINNSEKCICPHVRDTEKGHSIQMVLSTVLPDETDTPERLKRVNFAHPIHLHGHYIHVVDIQFGEYNEDGVLESTNKDINCSGTYNCTNPTWRNESVDYAYNKTGKINPKAPLKDTLLIPAGGYAVVYFKANNPGYWFIHCHIEIHVLNGMSAVIAEEVSRATPPPMEMLNCGSFSDYTVDQFKIDREANGNDENNNNEGDDGNDNEGDDGNNNEEDDGNNNANEGDDGNTNDEGGHHGEGHDDGGNVVKFEIILIMLLCIGVLWSTN